MPTRGVTATIDIVAFRADWATHMPIAALCQRWTITKDQVLRLRDVWHLPLRNDRRLRHKPERQRDPTPAEIAAACLRLQEQWDETTRESRLVMKSKPVQLRRIELAGEAREAVQFFDHEE